jgi:hypothetical protein
MRTALSLLLLALSAAPAAAAGDPSRPTWTHVRPLTADAAGLLADAAQRSTAVAAMLQDLEKSDVVVFLTESLSPSKAEARASLKFVSRAADIRFLLVTVNRSWFVWSECIASLGHELHHALEIAAAPEVVDSAGVARLYRLIGWEGRRNRFESSGAIAAGHTVRNQLAGLDR